MNHFVFISFNLFLVPFIRKSLLCKGLFLEIFNNTLVLVFYNDAVTVNLPIITSFAIEGRTWIEKK